MAFSAFDDRSREPTRAEVAAVLGKADGLWDDLRAAVDERFAPLDQTWVWSGKSWGWGLRLRQKKRTVLHLTPCAGHFYAGFALGGKAVAAAHAAPLPKTLLALIDSSQTFAEGRAVRLKIRSARAVRHAIRIAEIKMAS